MSANGSVECHVSGRGCVTAEINVQQKAGGDKGKRVNSDVGDMAKVLKEKHLYFDRVVISCKVQCRRPWCPLNSSDTVQCYARGPSHDWGVLRGVASSPSLCGAQTLNSLWVDLVSGWGWGQRGDHGGV